MLKHLTSVIFYCFFSESDDDSDSAADSDVLLDAEEEVLHYTRLNRIFVTSTTVPHVMMMTMSPAPLVVLRQWIRYQKRTQRLKSLIRQRGE